MLTFIDFETGEWLVDFAIWTVHRRISTRRQICICPRADLKTYDGPICIARMMSFRNNFRGIRKSHLQHSASFSSKIYSGKETMFWLRLSFFKACSTIGIRNITKSSVYVFFSCRLVCWLTYCFAQTWPWCRWGRCCGLLKVEWGRGKVWTSLNGMCH